MRRKAVQYVCLGSVRAVVDGSGTVKETRDFYPMGLRMPGRSLATSSPTAEDFTGHELDDATGLHYAGARYYMSALGRWTTPDPILDGNPKELLKQDTRLLSMSPYNYAFDNPTNLTDPNGECPVCVVGAWAVAEIAMSAYDAYDVYTTTTDPNVSALEKTASIGGAAAGLLLPGGGYSAVDNVAKLTARFADAGRAVRSISATDELSEGTVKAFRTIDNNIGDHLTPSDLSGAVKDLQGNPVMKSSGEAWQHLTEVTNAQRGLANELKTLKGALGNDELGSQARALIEKKISRTSRFLDETEKLVPTRFRKAME